MEAIGTLAGGIMRKPGIREFMIKPLIMSAMTKVIRDALERQG